MTHLPVWIPVCVGLAGIAGLATHAGAQQSAVSPVARAAFEGSAGTYYPLGRANSRFQQVYQDLGAARLVSGHAYRRDAISARDTIAAFQVDLMVQLSTASLAPAQASRTFASNAGQNPTTVLARTQVAFPQSQRPTSAPGSFVHRVPYTTPYRWNGTGSLCMEIAIYGNQTQNGKDKNFSADLDAHELFASGRNLQPGFPFGQGCGKPAAQAGFLVRHLGKTADLQIDLANGVPTTSQVTGQSLLVLGHKRQNLAWPAGTGCTVYNEALVVLFLAGPTDAQGNWQGTLPLGTPVAPATTVFAQLASMGGSRLVLSDAAVLTMPPAGPGEVSARIANGTSNTATTGTVSYTVPVTEFF